MRPGLVTRRRLHDPFWYQSSIVIGTMQQVIGGIKTSKFATNIAVGGSGGDVFCLAGCEDHHIRSITFFRTNGAIRCLSCYKSDGTNISLGERVCDPKSVTFSFSSDELVTKMYLYSTPNEGGRFAGIKVTTTKQDCLEAYAYNYTPSAQDEVEVAVGVGKWNGIFGRSGVDIDCFGVAMLKY